MSWYPRIILFNRICLVVRADGNRLKVTMYHFFFINQMGCPTEEFHKRVDIVGPVIENLFRILLLLREVHNIGQAIHLRINHLLKKVEE